MEDIAPSTQGTPGAGYYQADDYRPPVRADVTEEWDDDGGMLYGDWEENDEELIYEREDNETPVNSQHRPYYAGEVPMPSIESSRRGYPTHTTHDLSTRNLPIAAPQAQAVPSRVYEESQRYQRTTQPLNSQALMRLDREQLRQGAPTGIAPQPQRTRQPGRQEMVPATSTRLAPMAKQKTACPHCHGAGFLRSDVPFGHPNFGKPVPCACKEAERKERRRQQLRDMSNLDSFRDKSFNTFNSRVPGVAEAFEYCRVYAQSPDGWLLLVGVNGSGKTHLALAIANQCLDSGSVVLFSVVPDLLDHLRAAFAPTSEEIYDQLFAKMREAEVLVLDDLGAQQSSSWASEKLFQLLNYRYNMGMPTVITANPKGLQGIDERIRSRLSDNNLVTRLNFERAQDYRPHHPRRAAR
jgi:DNA replication protein DnaC